jgi:hypothetical protein
MAYPLQVSWNLPINFSRLGPSLAQRLLRFLNNEDQMHWAAYHREEPVGFLSWEPSRTSSDLLWLAAGKEQEDLAAQALLLHARDRLFNRRRTLSLNYPAEQAVDGIARAGFTSQYTLVWMSIAL